MAFPVITRTKATAGSSDIWIPDFLQNPFNIGIQAVVTGSVSSYTVEYTLNDTTSDSFVASSATWTAITNLSAVSASVNTVFTIPCRGIRLTYTTGSGSVTVTFQQAGTR